VRILQAWLQHGPMDLLGSTWSCMELALRGPMDPPGSTRISTEPARRRTYAAPKTPPTPPTPSPLPHFPLPHLTPGLASFPQTERGRQHFGDNLPCRAGAALACPRQPGARRCGAYEFRLGEEQCYDSPGPEPPLQGPLRTAQWASTFWASKFWASKFWASNFWASGRSSATTPPALTSAQLRSHRGNGAI